MNLLIIGQTILAQGPFVDDGENIRAYTHEGKADAVYPKHVIDGYVIVDAEVPEGFACAGYTWDEAGVVAKEPVVALPTKEEYTADLELMYDEKAHERRYDNRLTCALRAGYAGPFQAEGTAFAIWMDTCNATAYGIMAQVLAGEIPQPTLSELRAMMPVMDWPA